MVAFVPLVVGGGDGGDGDEVRGAACTAASAKVFVGDGRGEPEVTNFGYWNCIKSTPLNFLIPLS